jgi:hypothetical protein
VGGESYRNSQLNQLWKGIWNAPVQQKIKLFIFPTKLNLFQKKACNSLSCDLCDDEPESVMHVLVDCKFAQEVWGLSNLASIQKWPSVHLFADWVHHGFQNLNSPDIALLFTFAWKVWMAKNDRLWEEHFVTAWDLVCQAGSLTTEFLDLVQVSNEHFKTVPQKWHPPNISVSKINVVVQWRSQIRGGGCKNVKARQNK